MIKVALHRARPGELFYTGWSALSFPSGHSTVNLVLYGFLAFLIGRELHPPRRLPVAFGAAVFVLLIAFSRIYLGAHWLSDVVGGLTFGTAWLTALGLSYLSKRSEPVGAVGLIIVGTATLAVAGTLNIYFHHTLDVERYAAKGATPTMAAAGWWTTGWRELPIQRIDLTGEVEEPLTIQWAGSCPHCRRCCCAQPLLLQPARKAEGTRYVYVRDWKEYYASTPTPNRRVSLGPDQSFAPRPITWREHVHSPEP